MNAVDIILSLVILLLVLFFINMGIKNSRIINKSALTEKVNKIDEVVKKVADKPTMNKSSGSNYLHDYFNKAKPIEQGTETFKMKEVSEQELLEQDTESTNDKSASNDLNYTDTPNEVVGEFENNSTSNIVNNTNNMTSMGNEDYEEDFDIGVDSELDFTNAISKEFSELSPEMKAFIMTNMLKNNNNEYLNGQPQNDDENNK